MISHTSLIFRKIHAVAAYALKQFRRTGIVNETLGVEKISGRNYYYYSQWGWVKGKCWRLWQKYLGKTKISQKL
jgi:hypothetical protein